MKVRLTETDRPGVLPVVRVIRVTETDRMGPTGPPGPEPEGVAFLDVAQVWTQPQTFLDESIDVSKIANLGSVLNVLSADLEAHRVATDPHPNYATDVNLADFDASLTGASLAARINSSAALIDADNLALPSDLARLGAAQTWTATQTFPSIAMANGPTLGAASASRFAVGGWLMPTAGSSFDIGGGGGNRWRNAYVASLDAQTINASSIGAIITGATAQTANLTEWRDSAGVVLAKVESTGALVVPFGGAGGARIGGTVWAALANSASAIPLVARGFASQTGDLQQWQDSTGAILARLRADGEFRATRVYSGDLRGNNGSGPVYINGGELVLTGGATAQSGTTLRLDTTSVLDVRGHIVNGASGPTLVLPNTAAVVGLAVRGQVSQTAALQQWQNSAGSVLAQIASDGTLQLGSAALSPRIGINTRTVLAAVAVTQEALSNNAGLSYGDHSLFPYSHLLAGAANAPANPKTEVLRVAASRPVETPYIARGATSQTADLQQWQDSTGAVLARISSTGEVLAQASANNAPALIGALGNSDGNQYANFTVGRLSDKRSWNFSARANDRFTFFWQQSGTGPYSNVMSLTTDGRMRLGPVDGNGMMPNDTAAATLLVGNLAASDIGSVVRGAVSQTADLQQWQNSAGTVLSSVLPAGGLNFTQSDQTWLSYNGSQKARWGNSGSEIVWALTAMGMGATVLQWGDGASVGYQDNVAHLRVRPWRNSTSRPASTSLLVEGRGMTAGVSNKALTTNVATITTAAAHGFAVGKTVAITGVDATFNGNYVITSVPTTTTFTYAKVAADVASTASTGSAFSLWGTGTLQEWHDPVAGLLSRIDPDGALVLKTSGGANGGSTETRLHSSPLAQGLHINQQVFADGAFRSNAGFNPNTTGSANTILNGSGIGTTGAAAQMFWAGNGTSWPLDVAVGSRQSFPGAFRFRSTYSDLIGMVVQGAAGQTADKQQWQDSAGVVRARVAAGGSIYTVQNMFANQFISEGAGPNFGPAIRNGGTDWRIYIPAGEVALAIGGSSGGQDFWKASWTATAPANLFRSASSAAAQVVSVVKGAASQTADLQQWQDSAGAVQSRVLSDGSFVISPSASGTPLIVRAFGVTDRVFSVGSSGNIAANAAVFTGSSLVTTPLQVISGVAATVTSIVKGFAAQSANLQEWRDSGDAVKASISPAGAATVGSVVTGAGGTLIDSNVRTNGRGSFGTQSFDAQVFSVSALATRPAMIARGAASQSADLQQWQDNGSAVKVKVTAAGDLDFPSSAQGVIYTSPDGLTRKRAGIDNAGNFVLTTV